MMAPRLAALALVTALAGPLPAQSALPTVHVIATGGTISNTDGDRLTGDALVASLPGIEKVANVTVEQFSNVSSGSITLEQWLRLAQRINEAYRTRPELTGVVVTHGTDTMEETAYFLDLTVAECRPVVVTGAMRRATDIGADGPANLYDAIQLAASPDARNLGAVVLLNDYFYPAREVTKLNTSRVNAFDAPDAGPVGVADPDTLVFFDDPDRRACDGPRFDVSGLTELPRVDILYAYLGADGALVRAAVAAGARGIVTAGVGRGGTTPGMREAVREAVEQGVIAVSSSRTQAGRVPVGDQEEELEEWTPGKGFTLGADDLTPQKARILLMLALSRTQDPREIMEMFQQR